MVICLCRFKIFNYTIINLSKNKYKSFYSFADKEIVKIKKDFMDIPIFYVNFNNAEWQKEIKSIFTENKRNFNYHIASEHY